MPIKTRMQPAAGLALALALTGCADPDAPAPPATVVIVAGAELQALNPLINADANTHQVLAHLLFLPLVRLDDSLRVVPGLARSWTFEGDSIVTFQLREDVRWHDGRSTSADDVVFTFRRMKDPATGYPTPEYFERWDSATPLGPHTVRFHVRPHTDPLLGWTVAPIVPAHLLDSVPAERMREAAFNRQPTGNGAFRLASHANGQWVFTANADYPAELGKPSIQRLIWRAVPDNNAQVAELRSGAADIILGARAEQARALDADPALRAMVSPSRRYLMVGWNTRRPLLRDARARRALAMALNRAQMLTVVRGGFGELAATPVAPFLWLHDATVTSLPFDTVAARALLDSAVAGRPRTLELKIPANNQFNADVAELIRADLARIGVTVRVRPTEFATLIEDISSPTRRFDAVLMGFETDLRPDFRELFHSRNIDGPLQLASYSNPRMDALLDSVARTSSPADARPIWSEIQRLLRAEQPWTVLWFSPDIIAMNERVRGVQGDIRGLLASLPRWRVETGTEP